MKLFFLNWQLFIPLLLTVSITLHAGRSIFRPEDPHIPTIEVCFEHDKNKHILKDYHLEEYPVFHTYDAQYFNENLLPQKAITYRYNPQQTVDGKTLSILIETLIAELMAPRKHKAQILQEFEHFTIIKKRDFDWRSRTGTLIVKFKDYPFVVKLFRETPEGFVHPFDKGFEPTCFFLMGSTNRHISGLTRLKNLEYVQARIQEHPEWRNTISFPRKWFWVPQENRMLTIVGTNIGPSGKPLTTNYPSIYAVVADAIDIERDFTLTSYDDRQLALSLSKYLKSYIDAHINNFVVEKNTGKTVIIDTEHFPTVVGLHRELPGKGYVGWYGRLAAKRLRDTYGRTKCARRDLQKRGRSPLCLPEA